MLACSLGAPPKTLGRQVSLCEGQHVGLGVWKEGGDVQMAVKVDDGDGTVFAVDGAEEGECDCVIAS